MPQITIKIAEIGTDANDYVQYQSVISFITIDKEDYILESTLLDSEDDEADLEVIQGFVGMWEIRAEHEGMRFEIDETVTELEINLNLEIGNEEENEN